MEISIEIKDQPKENQPDQKEEDEEELIADFSQMFKGKFSVKRPPKLSSRVVEPTPNWLLEIPTKIQMTKEQLCQRKVLQQKRWKSMVKCDQQYLRVLASVISCWNYLFSSKGMGNQEALTLKVVQSIFDDAGVRYTTEDQFERADLVIKCFETLCSKFYVNSSAKIVIKPTEPNRIQTEQGQYLNNFIQNLKREDTAFVLLTYQNVLCPIGFDKTPWVPLDAYKKLQEIKPQNIELWIINASTQRFQPSFISKRWTDIKKNIQTVWPNYTDLDEPKKGQQRRPQATQQTQAQQRGSSHCIIQFRKASE